MLLSHTLTMRGSDEACLVEFRPVVKETRDGEMERDGVMDGRRTHGKKC